jgi:tRNA nucleotidyltransferase (CCA-adding enzyme)
MKIYLVGGAVRDELMGLAVKERDWVVVGATPQEMLALGYRPVGKDFPVFLHPETHEEYALARTERKTAPGYKGFIFHAAPDVTLEEDLKRRDLTINAMAKSSTGEVIDPYGGREDLKLRLFRHVSPAFVEDPVRILRIARFAARFGKFSVDEATLDLMRELVKNGEVDALVAERVWQELEKALLESEPGKFFAVLIDCGALHLLFPELEERSSGLEALKNAVLSSDEALVRFAALLYPLTKAAIEKLCQRYRVPREYQDLAIIVAGHHEAYQRIHSLDAVSLLGLLEALDVFRRPGRLEQFLVVCAAIYQGDGVEGRRERLRGAYELAKRVDAAVFVKRGLTGMDVGKAIRAQQIVGIEDWLIGLH